MGLKKLGQDIVLKINSNESSYLRNASRNRNTADVDTTGMEDAAAGYKTAQAGARAVEITFELMHPADGEPADQVYTDVTAALAARGTVDVEYDGDTYEDMSVMGGEDTAAPDEVVTTKITMKLTKAPAGS